MIKGKRQFLSKIISNKIIQRVLNSYHVPEVRCLNYHRIINDTEYDDGVISSTPNSFVRQMNWLKNNKNIINGGRIIEYILSNDKPSNQEILITFDDGYIDNYYIATEILSEYEIKCIFFITSNFIETNIIPPWDDIAYSIKKTDKSIIEINGIYEYPIKIIVKDKKEATKYILSIYSSLDINSQNILLQIIHDETKIYPIMNERLFMNWKEIKELSNLGHYIGIHTHTHPNLSTLNEMRQKYEIIHSKDLIESNIERESNILAYPFGKNNTFNNISKKICHSNNIFGAFSFNGGRNNKFPLPDPYDIKRLTVDQNMSMSLFISRITPLLPL